MTDNNNYFAISRKLLKSDRWLHSGKFTKGQAWVDLIGNARWKTGYTDIGGRAFKLKRGQLCRSISGLATRWRWSRDRVRRFLNTLETRQEIIHQNIFLTTLITITNYDAYQGGKAGPITDIDTSVDTGGSTANDTSVDTQKKKEKKEKKVKKENKENKGAIPDRDKWLEYAKEKDFFEEGANEAFDHYESVGWKVNNGNAIKNWQATLRQALSRDKKWNPDRYAGQQNFVANLLSEKYHEPLRIILKNSGRDDLFDKYCHDRRLIPGDIKAQLAREVDE